ncbi:hypothetical protein PHYSODRAFT_500400 [Phytophthora sojae]|uniref:Retrotransposon gag domain-containing protein n=1 Tax=Phytophthora sojae (strain P6497) TaxID=1094619 RepID=G4ZD09_PHYSP|nr:hypothetical protein PHYSODRAFT_500400 [Phytophthora sojae]EGZ18957.1 hypothetical protein PHYSODRAFT_500400 [Phytophthora sojae]|eukprot:XP_009528015.1 hypothetical protein PHYSODRAFT_500400 [Phytophthora sojae]
MENQEGRRRTTVKFKSRGYYQGTKEVAPFAGGDWKTWLQFQQELNRTFIFLFIFLDMDDTDAAARGMQQIITQLLEGRDLDTFTDSVQEFRNDEATHWRVIEQAMDRLTARYCPMGTREQLHDEVKELRKTRNMTVTEYAKKFEELLALERWILDYDGERMDEAERCRYFSPGMPRAWQMQVESPNRPAGQTGRRRRKDICSANKCNNERRKEACAMDEVTTKRRRTRTGRRRPSATRRRKRSWGSENVTTRRGVGFASRAARRGRITATRSRRATNHTGTDNRRRTIVCKGRRHRGTTRRRRLNTSRVLSKEMQTPFRIGTPPLRRTKQQQLKLPPVHTGLC